MSAKLTRSQRASASAGTPPIALPRLERVPRVPARDVVAEQLLAMFRSGTLTAGDQLPTESEIMRLTGVGRSTVREAVRTLASMQLVEVRRGSGTYVADRADRHLEDPQMLLHLGSHQALADLVEARRIVDPAIALLAAQRALPEELAAMEQTLAAMGGRRTRRGGGKGWRVAHLAFHTALARATHNVVLTRTWASVATFLRDSPLVGSTPPSNWGTSGLPLHERLYRAIAAHDLEQSAAAMDAHVADMTAYLARAVAQVGVGRDERAAGGNPAEASDGVRRPLHR